MYREILLSWTTLAGLVLSPYGAARVRPEVDGQRHSNNLGRDQIRTYAGIPEGNTLPKDPNVYRNAMLWRKDHKKYLSKLPHSRQRLKSLASEINCPPRVKEWESLVRKLNSSEPDGLAKLDDKTKIEIVNIWVNSAIAYDYEKGKKADEGGSDSKDAADWYNTPLETLKTGKGVCGDIARLKLETLTAAGIVPENDMRLVIGSILSEKPSRDQHEELMVHVDGKNYMLNNNLFSDGALLLHSGGLETDYEQLGIDSKYGFGLIPVESDRINGRITYYNPQQMDNQFKNEIEITPAFIQGPYFTCPVDETGLHYCIDAQKEIDPKIMRTITDTLARARSVNTVTGSGSLTEPVDATRPNVTAIDQQTPKP